MEGCVGLFSFMLSFVLRCWYRCLDIDAWLWGGRDDNDGVYVHSRLSLTYQREKERGEHTQGLSSVRTPTRDEICLVGKQRQFPANHRVIKISADIPLKVFFFSAVYRIILPWFTEIRPQVFLMFTILFSLGPFYYYFVPWDLFPFAILHQRKSIN